MRSFSQLEAQAAPILTPREEHRIPTKWTSYFLSAALAVAVGLLAMRFLDMFWWVEPAFNHEGQYFFWLLDVSAWVGVGGLYIWWFLGQLRSRPLLPFKDPNMAEALSDD